MDETLTDVVNVRYPYVVRGRIKGGKVENHIVSAVMPVSFPVVDPLEAPLAARVERDVVDHVQIMRYRVDAGRDAAVPRQVFEYRRVEGVLMRSMKQSDGLRPLTFDHLASLDASKGEPGYVGLSHWRDHPTLRPASETFGEGLLIDRSELVLRAVETDGSQEAMAAAGRDMSGMRVVGGVLHRPAPPPVWAAMGFRGHVRVCAVVPDLDYVRFRDPDATSNEGPSRTLPTIVAPVEVGRDRLLASLRSVFYAVERVSDDGGRAEVFDPDAVRDVAFVMTRLMRDFLRRELESVEWRRLPTRLRARLACLEEAALDATLPAFDPRAAQRRVDALFGEVDALLGELPDISGFDPARLRELFNGRFVASLLEDECRHPEPDFEGLAP